MLEIVLDTFSPVSIAVAIATVVITIAYHIHKSRGLPPGPMGLPFLGYWPFINSPTGHLKLDAMKKKYGDVFSFTCTGTLYINLGSHRAVREAHITKADCFSEKMTSFSLLRHIFEDAVVFANGETWKVLRKFFLQVFKERLSMKYNNLGSVYDSMKQLVIELKSSGGKPVDIIELMMDKCTSIMRLTLFGDIGTTDEKIKEINELYAGILASMASPNLLLTGNISKYLIFPLMAEYRVLVKNHKKIEKILHEMIEEHKSTYDKDNIRDIIDEYIKERNEKGNKRDPTAKYYTDKALADSLIQFLGDGVIVVAQFTSMFLTFLLDHPEEQQKIYEELMEVVGPDRQPTAEDKSQLVYLNAFFLETLRKADFFPYFPSLKCKKETTLNGYRIPVGAVTLMNLMSSHYDPEVYEEPKKFNPSRYVTKEGKKKAELPLTFGVGRRSCLGEGYVMFQVFLAVATIVKNFRISYPEDTSLNTSPVDVKMYITARERK